MTVNWLSLGTETSCGRAYGQVQAEKKTKQNPFRLLQRARITKRNRKVYVYKCERRVRTNEAMNVEPRENLKSAAHLHLPLSEV